VHLSDYLNHLESIAYLSNSGGEIAAAKSIGATYQIGETNSVACHGLDGVSNTMGAALWMIDYSLVAASIGVDRLFFHNEEGGFYYSMWDPTAVNATVGAFINPG